MLGRLYLIKWVIITLGLNLDPHSRAAFATTRKIGDFNLEVFQLLLHWLFVFLSIHVLSISKVFDRLDIGRICSIFGVMYILKSCVKCLFRMEDLRFIFITLQYLCITGDDFVTAVYRRVHVLVCWITWLVIRLIHRYEAQLNIIFWFARFLGQGCLSVILFHLFFYF